MRDQMQAATANKHFNNFSEYWSYLVTQKKIAADIQKSIPGSAHPSEQGPQGPERNATLDTYARESAFRISALCRLRLNPPSSCAGSRNSSGRPVLDAAPRPDDGSPRNEVCDALVGGVKL